LKRLTMTFQIAMALLTMTVAIIRNISRVGPTATGTASSSASNPAQAVDQQHERNSGAVLVGVADDQPLRGPPVS
jgi:hypothetical protein